MVYFMMMLILDFVWDKVLFATFSIMQQYKNCNLQAKVLSFVIVLIW